MIHHDILHVSSWTNQLPNRSIRSTYTKLKVPQNIIPHPPWQQQSISNDDKKQRVMRDSSFMTLDDNDSDDNINEEVEEDEEDIMQIANALTSPPSMGTKRGIGSNDNAINKDSINPLQNPNEYAQTTSATSSPSFSSPPDNTSSSSSDDKATTKENYLNIAKEAYTTLNFNKEDVISEEEYLQKAEDAWVDNSNSSPSTTETNASETTETSASVTDTSNSISRTLSSIPTLKGIKPKSTIPKSKTILKGGINKSKLSRAGARESFLSKSKGSSPFFASVSKGDSSSPILKGANKQTSFPSSFKSKGGISGSGSLLPKALPKVPTKIMSNKVKSFSYYSNNDAKVGVLGSKKGLLSKGMVKGPITEEVGGISKSFPKMPTSKGTSLKQPTTTYKEKNMFDTATSFLKGSSNSSSQKKQTGFLSGLGKALFGGDKKASNEESGSEVPYGLRVGKSKTPSEPTALKGTTKTVEKKTAISSKTSTIVEKKPMEPIVTKYEGGILGKTPAEPSSITNEGVITGGNTLKSDMSPVMKSIKGEGLPNKVKEKKEVEKNNSLKKGISKTIPTPKLTQQLTDGITAEEAEQIRKNRLSGNSMPEKTTLPTAIEEGSTAEDAELVRLERLKAADETAKTLKGTTKKESSIPSLEKTSMKSPVVEKKSSIPSIKSDTLPKVPLKTVSKILSPKKVTVGELKSLGSKGGEPKQFPKTPMKGAAAFSTLSTPKLGAKGDSDELVDKSKTTSTPKLTQQLTDGITAEEAEQIRKDRLSGKSMPVKKTTTPTAIEEGSTAEDAEAVRLERLKAADEVAKSLQAKESKMPADTLKSSPTIKGEEESSTISSNLNGFKSTEVTSKKVGGLKSKLEGLKGKVKSSSSLPFTKKTPASFKGGEKMLDGILSSKSMEGGVKSSLKIGEAKSKLSSPPPKLGEVKVVGSSPFPFAKKTPDTFKGGKKSLDGIFGSKAKTSSALKAKGILAPKFQGSGASRQISTPDEQDKELESSVKPTLKGQEASSTVATTGVEEAEKKQMEEKVVAPQFNSMPGKQVSRFSKGAFSKNSKKFKSNPKFEAQSKGSLGSSVTNSPPTSSGDEGSVVKGSASKQKPSFPPPLNVVKQDLSKSFASPPKISLKGDDAPKGISTSASPSFKAPLKDSTFKSVEKTSTAGAELPKMPLNSASKGSLDGLKTKGISTLPPPPMKSFTNKQTLGGLKSTGAKTVFGGVKTPSIKKGGLPKIPLKSFSKGVLEDPKAKGSTLPPPPINKSAFGVEKSSTPPPFKSISKGDAIGGVNSKGIVGKGLPFMKKSSTGNSKVGSKKTMPFPIKGAGSKSTIPTGKSKSLELKSPSFEKLESKGSTFPSSTLKGKESGSTPPAVKGMPFMKKSITDDKGLSPSILDESTKSIKSLPTPPSKTFMSKKIGSDAKMTFKKSISMDSSKMESKFPIKSSLPLKGAAFKSSAIGQPKSLGSLNKAGVVSKMEGLKIKSPAFTKSKGVVLKGKESGSPVLGKGMPFMKKTIASSEVKGFATNETSEKVTNIPPLKSFTKTPSFNKSPLKMKTSPMKGFEMKSKSMSTQFGSKKLSAGKGMPFIKKSMSPPMKTVGMESQHKGDETGGIEDEETTDEIDLSSSSMSPAAFDEVEATTMMDSSKEELPPPRNNLGGSFTPQAFTPPQARKRPESPADTVDGEPLIIRQQSSKSLKKPPTKIFGGDSFYGTTTSRVYGLPGPAENKVMTTTDAKDEPTSADKDIIKKTPVETPKEKSVVAESRRKESANADKPKEERRLVDDEERISSLLADAERKMALQLDRIEEERNQMKREQAQLENKMLEAEKSRAKEANLLEKRLSEEMIIAKQKLQQETDQKESERARSRAREEALWIEEQQILVQKKLEERVAEEKAKADAAILEAKQKLKQEVTKMELERTQARELEESQWMEEQQKKLDEQLAEERAKVKAELSQAKQVMREREAQQAQLRLEEEARLTEEQNERVQLLEERLTEEKRTNVKDEPTESKSEADKLEELDKMVEERLQLRIDELMKEREEQAANTQISASDLLPKRSLGDTKDTVTDDAIAARSSSTGTPPFTDEIDSTSSDDIKEDVAVDALATDPKHLELVQMCLPAEFDPSSPIYAQTSSEKIDKETCLLPSEYPFVSLLRDSSPYIVNHRQSTIVFHLPGDLISNVSRFNSVIDDIALTWLFGMKIVICVGCRKQVLERMKRMHRNDGYFDSSSMRDVMATDFETLRVLEEEAGFVRFEVERVLNRCLRNKGADCNVVSGAFVSAKQYGIVDGKDYKVRNLF